MTRPSPRSTLFPYTTLFRSGFLSRDDRGISGQREVDARVGYQVGLEFCQINIQGPIKSEGSSDGRDRKSTRLNSSHTVISYAVFCLKKKPKRRCACRGTGPR